MFWLFSRHMQGTADDIVDCSHGKKLYDLCKHKYDPLWLEGANHCNLEVYSQYTRHLKKFIIAMEKPSNNSTNIQDSNSSKKKTQDSEKTLESKSSTDHLLRENRRKSTSDIKLRASKSTYQIENPRKSNDRYDIFYPTIFCFVFIHHTFIPSCFILLFVD